jgi:hypothetical protein
MEEELSAKLLSNNTIFLSIYQLIQQAANLVTTEPDYTIPVAADKQNVRLLETKTTKIRKSPDHISITGDKDTFIEYNSRDLTIVGGAVLKIFNIKLHDILKGLGIISLKEYLKRETPDIDLVWWPRISINHDNSVLNKEKEYIITSESPAIHTFVNTFVEALKETVFGAFHTNWNNIRSNCGKIIGSSVIPNIRAIHIVPAGVWNIIVEFVMENKTVLKIAEIAVHDSGSGQAETIVQANGRSRFTLQAMVNDPIYMSEIYDDLSPLHVEYVDKEFTFNIPQIEHYLFQQFYAIQNRIKYVWSKEEGPSKVIIHHKRIEYIYKLLTAISAKKLDAAFYDIFGKNRTIASLIDYINKISSNIEWIYSCPSNEERCYDRRVEDVCFSKNSNKIINKELCTKLIAKRREEFTAATTAAASKPVQYISPVQNPPPRKQQKQQLHYSHPQVAEHTYYPPPATEYPPHTYYPPPVEYPQHTYYPPVTGYPPQTYYPPATGYPPQTYYPPATGQQQPRQQKKKYYGRGVTRKITRKH